MILFPSNPKHGSSELDFDHPIATYPVQDGLLGLVVVHEYDNGNIVVREMSSDGRPTIETQKGGTKFQEKFRLNGQQKAEL